MEQGRAFTAPRSLARPRPAHRPSRRSEIIAAAISDLGSAESFETVTGRQVMARTGMSTSALYYHFPTMDELLVVVVEEVFRGVACRCTASAQDLRLTPWVLSMMRRQADWISGRPEEARLLVAFSNASLGGRQVLEASHDELASAVRQIAAVLTALRPTYTELTAEVTARALVCLVIEFADAAGRSTATAGPDALLRAAEVVALRLVTDDEKITEPESGVC